MSQVANTFWVDESAATTATIRVRTLAKRRTRVRRMIDALVCAVILASTALCASVYYRTHGELAGAVSRHQSAAIRLAELKRETEKLEREVQQLKTDPRMIEAVAREKLGFVRPGDKVIRLGQESDAESTKVLKIKAADNQKARLTPRITGRYTPPSN